jgi:1,4-alpha-glucan branching enzyme
MVKTRWKEIFNSDNKEFWGTGDVFNPDIKAEKVNKDDKWYKLKIHLPALSAVVIR